MAALLHTESRRLYSWWWDSHNSRKNSKWLQENLADMDGKVKSMIKLIEEDADSFAKRAEMYYKKRPELIKLVEEFYRAYRALAERYDHATMELHQAHQTMAEAFPNQIPCGLAEDCPSGSSSMEMELHTPEMPHPMSALFDLPDDFQKDSVGLSHALKRIGVFPGDNDATTMKNGLKQLNEMFTFEEADHAIFAEERVRKGLNFHEGDIEEGSEHVYYHGSREHQKLALLDKEDFDRKIRSLEDEISQLSTENTELKAQVALESEHVHKAEAEVESLRQALSKLQAEDEATRLQYQQQLERLSNLEAEFSSGQEEIGRLILDGVDQSQQSEVDTLVQKMKMQQQELMGNHEELEKLRICTQDEKMHCAQAEASLRSLQNSYSQSQEEKKALKLELKRGLQMLKDMEFVEQALEEEVRQMTEENSILNKKNVSSQVLINNLQDEISSLKEMIGKLEEESELSNCQKNALQQDLYSLNGEKDDLKARYQDVMEQVKSVGLNATCLRSSVKDLQDENLNLKEICQKNNDEKEALLEDLENMEQLSEKNVILERSLSDTTASLEASRATLKTLEEYYQYLQDENLKLKGNCQKNDDVKVALLEKLANMEKLSEKNLLLEKSLTDTSAELQGLKTTIKTFEESYLSLQDENLELKDICQKNNGEKLVLLEKLKTMEKLSEKNILLQNSLSDASAELQTMRETIKALEKSYHFLQDEKLDIKEICRNKNEEKTVLLEKLENMEKVLEENMLLEKSLSDASAEVQGLRENLKTLEESFHSIQEVNSELKEICQKNDGEKLILLQKLESTEKLSEKNMLLEFSLSDTSAKLQELETKLKALEESFQSLQEEKFELVTEKEVLVSQVESITQNRKMLSEKNGLLENSLSYMNAELEALSAKSNNLEECCRSLRDEKSSLLTEQNDLASRVESLRLSLEELDQRHKELQNKHMDLERDNELTLHYVDKLQVLLNAERQEHANSIQSSKTECASLENKVHLLSEEAQQRKKDLEEEQVQFINAQIEIFVLQRSIHDIKERSLSLSVECQKYVEASTQVKNMISELEEKNLRQQEKAKSLLKKTNMMKMVINEVLKALDICVDDGCLDRIEDKVLLLHILERIEGMHSSILQDEDKNKLLTFEKTIHITLLQQLRIEINNLKTENYALTREAEIRKGELLMLHAETHKLLEEKKWLILEEQAGIHREEVLKKEIEKLDGRFLELQEAYQILLEEKSGLITEKGAMVSQVERITQNMKMLSEKNSLLENSLSYMNAELEGLRAKSNTLEESCQSFQYEKSSLLSEQNDLVSQAESCRLSLEDLEQRHKELHNKHTDLERERELTLIHVDNLQVLLNLERQEHANSIQSSKTQRASLENQMRLLQEEARRRNGDLEAEQFKVISAQIEIFVLQRCIHDIKQRGFSLSVEVEVRSEEISTLQAKTHKLLEENNRLIQEQQAGTHREEVLKNEIEKLDGKLSELEEAYQILLDEKYKLLDENFTLAKKVGDLKEEYHILREENDGILREAIITQSNLSLLFESISTEKAVVLKAFDDDFNCLCAFNSNLENEIREMIEKVRMVKTENLHLKESVERLEEYKSHSLVLEDELNMIRNINDRLNHQIEIGKNLLSHKEVTLLQVSQELEATQSENAELHEQIEEGRILEKNLESELQKKINEVEFWERENTKLHKEIEDRKIHGGHLESELLNKIDEVELWEREAASSYEDLNVSAICALLFKEKAMELRAACESLKRSAIIENQRFNNERAAYLPLILSLKMSVLSLEHHALSPTKVLATGNQEVQEAVAMAHQNDISNQGPDEDHSKMAAAPGILELKKLKAKVKDVEKVVIESMALALKESSNSKAKFNVAMEEIKELKLKRRSVPDDTETRKDVILLLEDWELSKDHELQRIDTEASQSKHGLRTKDIQLDHASDPSSHRNSSCGMAQIRISETDDQMLEFWETAETFEEIQKSPESVAANEEEIECYQIEVTEEEKSDYPSSELQDTNEVAVENPEVSTKAMVTSQEEKVRTVESLSSDARRLVNLQTSVQELKKKMDKSGKSKLSAAFEYDNMKVQLKEVEEAILQLVDINRKLTNKVKDSSSDSEVGEESGEIGNVRNPRTAEWVRKSSENIGRLELEVQKIQFMLLKHKDQHKNKGTKTIDRRKEAALRGYLQGGMSQRKKVTCCSCIRPATKDE